MINICSIQPKTIVIIILLLTLIIAAFIIIVLKNKTKNIGIYRQKKTLNKNIKLVSSYCSQAEMHFLETLHKTLPKDFIAFPYVPLEKLLVPVNGKVDYNIASTKVVDICIFLQKTMEPVLVIDLYSPSPANASLKKIDENIISLLKNANLPIVQIKLQEKYETNILKQDLLNSMNDKVFAKIKK